MGYAIIILVMKGSLVRSKKGFTLIELTVAMAVSLIAMSMLIFCLMSINSFLQNKQRQYNYIENLTSFKTSLQGVLENYQTTTFSLVQSSNLASFTLAGESQNYVVSYSESALFDNGEKIKDFDYINEVNFSTEGNLIKCNVEYGDNLIYTIILNKRV